MAKIVEVTLDKIPEYVQVDDHRTNTIIVKTQIEFHSLDISGNMEYLLHLFVYDVHGEKDIPVLISNWDDTKVFRVARNERKDDFLCKQSVLIKSDEANKTSKIIKTPMTMKLGKLQDNTSIYTRKFEVFATLIPAIDRVSKWSEPFESQLVFVD
ncbi:hypothetical protein AWE51_14890 [Aquimarina aggregata]|uniref:Uncharacterized protein n=1 Tax=Aquimarina aggregata TaxID=1642818 RepID=A0A162CL40_9FLAO|nr:hypothetical protein [Aquimarina aggregata]KZS38864.1 hypothetical protein AWE51_14890 [Aquimarina aggregata]